MERASEQMVRSVAEPLPKGMHCHLVTTISLVQVGFHDQATKGEVRPRDVEVTELLSVDGGDWDEVVTALEVPCWA